MPSGVSPIVLQGLRRWAQGAVSDQLAVELLARSFGGRYLRPGIAWVRPCGRPGWYWLDADALAAYAEKLTAESERRMLLLAAALVGGDPWTRRRSVESRHRIDAGRAVA